MFLLLSFFSHFLNISILLWKLCVSFFLINVCIETMRMNKFQLQCESCPGAVLILSAVLVVLCVVLSCHNAYVPECIYVEFSQLDVLHSQELS